ncbi:MAG: beta-ketoacyl-ACP synthase III [bacterium]
MKIKAGILGCGYYLPEKIMTNADIEKIVDTSDEWIRTRTGIEERRIAAEGECTSDMAVKAAERAIISAGIKKEEIELVVLATICPDFAWPATACMAASKLGLKDIPAFDVSAACSGFIYALTVARSMVESGLYKKVLLIAAEKFSTYLDWTDRNTCVLMGDGAGAMIIGASETSEIMSTYISADGSNPEYLYQPGGGSVHPLSQEVLDKKLNFMHMNGKEIYVNAVEKMPLALDKAMQIAGVTPEQVDFTIFHQANIRIIQYIAKKFNIPEEKNIVNIQRFGNTSAATIPIAFAEAYEAGKIKKGHIVAFSAFGGGLTWGGAVVKV